jgi:hypothetical protein
MEKLKQIIHEARLKETLRQANRASKFIKARTMKRYEIIRCAWRANRDLELGESRTPPIWGLFDHKLNLWAIKDVHRRLIQERIKDEGLDMNEKI